MAFEVAPHMNTRVLVLVTSLALGTSCGDAELVTGGETPQVGSPATAAGHTAPRSAGQAPPILDASGSEAGIREEAPASKEPETEENKGTSVVLVCGNLSSEENPIDATQDYSSSTIADLLRLQQSLRQQMGSHSQGTASFARDRKQLEDVDQAVVRRLREEATSLAHAGPERCDEAQKAFSRVEDIVCGILDMRMRSRDERWSDYYTTQYREIIDESDRFVERVFTPAYVEQVPWIDLLASEHHDEWQNYGLQQFRIDPSRLELLGPEAGAASNGLIAFPTVGGYRDFEVDMEFSVEGLVDMLFRLGRRVDNTVEYCTLGSEGDSALSPWRTYNLRARFVGSTLTGTVSPGSFEFPKVECGWTKSRKGALGFQVREGAKLKITKLRVCVLRGA